MSKLFNLEKNQILNTFSNVVDSKEQILIEDDDSYHFYVPIEIKRYYIDYPVVLAKTLMKHNFSINVVIMTNDFKVVIATKQSSYSYRHVINNTILITSYDDMINKIHILSRCLRPEEGVITNKLIRDAPVNSDKISFITVMAMLDQKIVSKEKLFRDLPVIPGGHISKSDESIIKTIVRELNEELSIPLENLENMQIGNLVYYHNIFDKFNEFFYHNLVMGASIDLSSTDIETMFKESSEIKEIRTVSVSSSMIPYKIGKLYRSITSDIKAKL